MDRDTHRCSKILTAYGNIGYWEFWVTITHIHLNFGGPSGLHEPLGFQNSMKIDIAQEAKAFKQTKGKCASPVDNVFFLQIMMSPDLLIIMLNSIG